MEKITTRRLSLSFYHVVHLLLTPTTPTLTPITPFLSPLFPTDPFSLLSLSPISLSPISLLFLLFSLFSFAAVLFSLPFFACRGSSPPFTPTSACRIYFRQQGISNLLLPVVLAIPFNS